MHAVGRARRRESHRATLIGDGDREVRAIPVGQRGRSLEGVAGALLAGQGQLHADRGSAALSPHPRRSKHPKQLASRPAS